MRRRLPPRPFLYPVVDVGLLGARPLGGAVGELARGGARILQLRAKDVPDARFLALAREALAAARAAGALLLVNDRPDIARIVGADGVHVGQEDLSPADVRALLGPGAIVGFSTHTLEQLRAAAGESLDYVAVGPVFATHTKARADPVVGLDFVRRARESVSLPLVAIGGITRESARSVIQAGADAVAVASGLLDASDLRAAAAEFVAALV